MADKGRRITGLYYGVNLGKAYGKAAANPNARCGLRAIRMFAWIKMSSLTSCLQSLMTPCPHIEHKEQMRTSIFKQKRPISVILLKSSRLFLTRLCRCSKPCVSNSASLLRLHLQTSFLRIQEIRSTLPHPSTPMQVSKQEMSNGIRVELFPAADLTSPTASRVQRVLYYEAVDYSHSIKKK